MTQMTKFFDKLEDLIREHLSRRPITYSIIGGVGVVLFWRAVWETADMLARLNPALAFLFYPPIQLLLSTILLLLTGLMVSIFIGDRIILSGLRHEKKLEEKTEELVEEEVITLKHIQGEIRELRSEIKKLSNNQ
jgi:hypothetical protein